LRPTLFLFGVLIKTIVLILSLLTLPSFAGDSSINFAPGINPTDLQKIHPKLLQIVSYISVFCKENRIQLVVTSAIRSKERNKLVGGVSETHTSGRAVDFSIKERWGWTPDLVWTMTIKVNKMYKQFGAFTNRPQDKQVVLFNHSVNPNEGTHIHLQVYKGLPWK
jgi:hypothetical protein